MAVTADRHSRMEELARPRALHPDYKKDRISVYWVDRLPMLPNNGRTKPSLTTRQEELVRPKRRVDATDAFGDPMWPVTPAAMSYEPTPRIHDLARHKQPSNDYQTAKSAQTKIPRPALCATPSARVENLAKPKEFFSLPIILPKQWNWSDWNDRVPRAALTARSSERVDQLASPKSCPPSFKPARTCMWPVTPEAKRREPTDRITDLAMPRARTMIVDDYDPYLISRATLKAEISPRVTELAMPVSRKMATK